MKSIFCELTSCTRTAQHFLPLVCTDCGKTFCSVHKFPDDHGCDRSAVDDSRPEFKGTKSYPCYAKDCSIRELMPVICDKCGNCFCLSHRHPQDHKCRSLEVTDKITTTTKPALNPPTGTKTVQQKPIARKARGGKSSKTAAKVALMKMKMHAVGDKGTPENERVFLQVLLPLGSVSKFKSLFFSKSWTTGRVIDSIADKVGLKNENNTASDKKLRIFSWEDGTLLELDKTLEHYLSTETILNGGNVILEYVSSETSCLNNLDDYKLS